MWNFQDIEVAVKGFGIKVAGYRLVRDYGGTNMLTDEDRGGEERSQSY